jgi:SMODS and SLOG-associating 2TM effector domain 1
MEDAHAQPSQPSRETLSVLQPIAEIGIVGHRDLADPAGAAVAAADALSRLLTMLEEAKWPAATWPLWRTGAQRNTSIRVGYRIVSPLAEGADRVGADLHYSSDTRLAGRHHELVVPLPFSRGAYRGTDGQPGTDCPDLESQQQFDQLTRDAKWVHPLHDAAPASDGQRNQWYSDVGDFVIEHCDFLFAFWDGWDNEKAAGTADIVKRALHRNRPVIWIPVTRKETAGSAGLLPNHGETQVLTGLTPDGYPLLPGPDLNSARAAAVMAGTSRDTRQSSRASRLVLERFGRLSELLRRAESDPALPELVEKEMQAPEARTEHSAEIVRSVSEWIVPSYVLADALAKTYQSRLHWLNRYAYAGAALAVTVGALAAIELGHHKRTSLLLFTFEALVLLALLVLQLTDLRTRWRNQWIAYRAMGEYFRIGRFLAFVIPATAAGAEFGRFSRLQSWSTSDPVSVPWFTPVLERVWENRPRPPARDQEASWLGAYLAARWIGDQMAYHGGRAETHRRLESGFQWWIRGTLILTFCLAVAHVGADLAGAPEQASSWLAVLVIALTAMASGVIGYSGLQRHRYHAERFARMATELARIQQPMRSATTLSEVRRNAEKARRIMLGETTSWYEDMEQQVIDPPV